MPDHNLTPEGKERTMDSGHSNIETELVVLEAIGPDEGDGGATTWEIESVPRAPKGRGLRAVLDALLKQGKITTGPRGWMLTPRGHDFLEAISE